MEKNKKIDCTWFEENIYALIDKEVSDKEKVLANKHLNSCAICQKLMSDAMKMEQELLALDCLVPSTPEAWTKFEARVASEASLDLDIEIPKTATKVAYFKPASFIYLGLGLAASLFLFVNNQDKAVLETKPVMVVTNDQVSLEDKQSNPIKVAKTVSDYQFIQEVKPVIETAELASFSQETVPNNKKVEAANLVIDDIPSLKEIVLNDKELDLMLEVTISSTEKFLIDKYPVTNKQYKKFVQKTKHRKPFNWDNNDYLAIDKDGLLPVTYVSWDDALAYCQFLNKDLPTAKQFESAAKGLVNLSKKEANIKDSNLGLVPVASFSWKASEFGVEELIGNIRHWVKDSAETDPFFNQKNRSKLQMGASFIDPVSRASNQTKYSAEKDTIPGNTGFRCVSLAN